MTGQVWKIDTGIFVARYIDGVSQWIAGPFKSAAEAAEYKLPDGYKHFPAVSAHLVWVTMASGRCHPYVCRVDWGERGVPAECVAGDIGRVMVSMGKPEPGAKQYNPIFAKLQDDISTSMGIHSDHVARDISRVAFEGGEQFTPGKVFPPSPKIEDAPRQPTPNRPLILRIQIWIFRDMYVTKALIRHEVNDERAYLIGPFCNADEARQYTFVSVREGATWPALVSDFVNVTWDVTNATHHGAVFRVELDKQPVVWELVWDTSSGSVQMETSKGSDNPHPGPNVLGVWKVTTDPDEADRQRVRDEEREVREHQQYLHDNFGRPEPTKPKAEPTLAEQLRDLRLPGVEWTNNQNDGGYGQIYRNGTPWCNIRVSQHGNGCYCAVHQNGLRVCDGDGATPGEAVMDAIDSAERYATDILSIVRTVRGEV